MPVDPFVLMGTLQMGSQLLNSVSTTQGGAIHIGPSYSPANGGEVRRQLENGYNPPWPNAKKEAFYAWCQQHRPDYWAGTASVWANYPDNMSGWGEAYDRYNGATLGRDMKPIPGQQSTNQTQQNPMGNPSPAATASTSAGGGGGATGDAFRGFWANLMGLAWYWLLAIGIGVVLLVVLIVRLLRGPKKSGKRKRRSKKATRY